MDRTHIQTLAKWAQRCDPDQRLTAEQLALFYVPFDAWSVGGRTWALRGPVMADALTQTIQLAAELPTPASAQLFAGFRGTGKSTELAAVAERLRDIGGFTVLHIDFKAYFNESMAPTPEELGLTLVAGVEEAARGTPPLDNVGGPGLWDRLADWWQEHRIELNPEASVKLGPLDLKSLLKDGNPALRSRLAAFVGSTPKQLQDFVHQRIGAYADAAGSNQLVLLVDNLEKFFAAPEDVVGIYRELAALFYHQVELLRIPRVHVIYTVPPYLGFLNRGLAGQYKVRVLPSVKITERPPERGAFGPGLDALVEVLRRRVDLPALFGSGDWREVTTRLAEASGGHVRDLLNLTQRVLLGAMKHQLPVARAEVDAIIQWAGSERANPMWKDLGELLHHVATTGSLQGLEETQLAALTRAMDEDLVLCFHNGEPWYDVHPLVRDRVPSKVS